MTQLSLAAEIIRHHLQIFGIAASHFAWNEGGLGRGNIKVAVRPTGGDAGDLRAAATNGAIVLAILPESDFLKQFEISELPNSGFTETFIFDTNGCLKDLDFRSLHSTQAYIHPSGERLIESKRGAAIWIKIRIGAGYIIVIGSDLAGDLTRYRQGDPKQAEVRPTKSLWGIAGERPNYLFDLQIPPGCEHERQADWWALALAETVSDCLGTPLPPLLPNGAIGAIVITGDDDQAFLEKYQEQLGILKNLPITYFLHPLTKHTKRSLREMLKKYPVELGLHPDALDKPTQYAEIYSQQAEWFYNLTGGKPESVRNHGFLNDGYWGHLPTWLQQGVRASSNLPGLDGKILNGSLLPARVAFNGRLTNHWSILTAIGDGVRFALNMDGPQSARCIRNLADRIRTSKIPGVIVLNLHPQNVADTQHMHSVLHDLVNEGFLAMRFSDCIDWFLTRDQLINTVPNIEKRSSFYSRLLSLLGLNN